MWENAFSIVALNQTEKSFECQPRTSSFWKFIAAIRISHTINDTAENLTLNLVNYFDFCMFTKVMHCVKYTIALVNKIDYHNLLHLLWFYVASP